MTENNNRYRAKIDSVLYGYYIKYETMKTLCDMHHVVQRGEDYIDVYVDLFNMLHHLYGTDVYADKKYTIVSSVINLAAHIREFFWSRYRVNTRIYLVYANETSNSHKQFYQGFGYDSLTETVSYDRTHKIISTQLELAKILCAYLYGIYYVERTCDFSSFVYHNAIQNGRKSIVFTKSKYAYQLPAMLGYVFLFRPKKIKGYDESYCVHSGNILLTHAAKYNEKAYRSLNQLHPNIYSLLLTLTNLPEKKVLSLMNLSSAVKLLEDRIAQGKIINGYNADINRVYQMLLPEMASRIDEYNFMYRFYAIDLVYQNYLYKNTAESKDTLYLVDFEDKQAVQHINNTYFADNPLNLECL